MLSRRIMHTESTEHSQRMNELGDEKPSKKTKTDMPHTECRTADIGISVSLQKPVQIKLTTHDKQMILEDKKLNVLQLFGQSLLKLQCGGPSQSTAIH